MAVGVNLLKLLDADLGVNGRGVEFLVAKQPLDEAHGVSWGAPCRADSTTNQASFMMHNVTLI